jgi:hypothetical protein
LSLTVTANDPFTADMPSRKAAAEWFTALWRRFGTRGSHLHGFHYVLVSQSRPVRMVGGAAYKNTKECESEMLKAALDARFLKSCRGHRVHRSAQRAADHQYTVEAEDAVIQTDGGIGEFQLPELAIPELAIYKPTILQRYHIEVWIEKSTMDEHLIPLCESYHINLIRGVGEMTYTRCNELVQRAINRAEGRPIRISLRQRVEPHAFSHGGRKASSRTNAPKRNVRGRRFGFQGGIHCGVAPHV